MGGAAVGTAICPVVGTFIGGILGGLLGGIGGTIAANEITEAVFDEIEYDIIVKICKGCGKKFKVRKYQGQGEKDYCPDCP